jgi:3',5'-cyclic AMP phosphodiesterase CpdA
MSGFTFAHVSDLHLPFEPRLTRAQRLSKRQLSVMSWRRRRALHRPDILEALVRDLRAEAVDHVLVTGDIVNFSLPEEFRQAAGWLAALGPAERISLVPGNHDALVTVPAAEGLDLWKPWTRLEGGWPYVHRLGAFALIGLNSARPTAPLLARGALGGDQLARLEQVLLAEGAEGRLRIVMLHHPPADGVVGWRKALADRAALRDVLRRAGAELVLHGHARDARLDAVSGPHGPIPCLGVPSSSAVPSPQDEGARWHRLRLKAGADDPRLEVEVRRWSPATQAFQADGRYELCLPRPTRGAPGHNLAL